ncbi:MAG: aldehyde dehydrogenase [Pseudomonadota bacterium]|nr:aldehyde dehydrogenase [Pseudomonadota bacterium]
MTKMTIPHALPQRVGSLIDGRDAPGAGHEIPVFYPATGRQISTLIEADAAEVDRAVTAARRAFDRTDWPRWSVDRRQALLMRINEVLLAHADELALLECLNLGVSLRELREIQMTRAAYNFRFFAEYISQRQGEVYDQVTGYRSIVVKEPVGVAALIAPWNAPTALASMKVAAALAFGNTCVLKPSEQTPLALRRFVELLHEAGVPEGVVNLVNGRGQVTGEALVAHPGIDLVSFTGGTGTGRRIMASAAQRLKPSSLELGGKSANVIFASADLDRALDGALLSIFSGNGQQCLAGSRILLEKSISADFIDRFVARARQLRIGDPMLDATEMGPLGSAAHRDRVLSYVDIAKADGAQILTGGGPAALEGDLAGGYFVQPTAVLAPSNASRVCQEEIFGPFATFVTFDGYDQAMQIANDTEFGLVSYVWSDHLPTVEAASRDLQAGVVWVNTPMTRDLRAPFGGYKNSGVGRESGASSEAFYTELKTVTIPERPLTLRRIGLPE